jgi:hypothetical protein
VVDAQPTAAGEPVRALCIAVLGHDAEALAQALAARLGAASGLACSWLPDAHQAWIAAHGREPDARQQADLERRTRRRIANAAAHHAVLVCAEASSAAPILAALPLFALHVHEADDGTGIDARVAAAFEACKPLLGEVLAARGGGGVFSRLLRGDTALAGGWTCAFCQAMAHDVHGSDRENPAGAGHACGSG